MLQFGADSSRAVETCVRQQKNKLVTAEPSYTIHDTQHVTRRMGYAQQCCGYIVKPIDFHLLVDEMAKVALIFDVVREARDKAKMA